MMILIRMPHFILNSLLNKTLFMNYKDMKMNLKDSWKI